MEVARRLGLLLAVICIAGLAWVILNGRSSSVTAQIILGTALTLAPAVQCGLLPASVADLFLQRDSNG